ncbi:MAG: hypothetical protein IJH34_04815 [Romboutsia sp.]|nr:hypothetical protein [Romboutsia sp.]
MVLKAKTVNNEIVTINEETESFTVEFEGDETVTMKMTSDFTVTIESSNGFGEVDHLIATPAEGRRICVTQGDTGVLNISEIEYVPTVEITEDTPVEE